MLEKEIDIICIKEGLRKLGLSNNPSWVNKTNQEGIEYKLGQICTFWIKDGNRVYGEPASGTVSKVYDILKSSGNGKGKDEKPGASNPEGAKNEMDKTKDQEKGKDQEIEKSNGVLIPDQMTSKLLEKWKNMSTFDRMLLFQTTPKQYIQQKPIGKDKNQVMQYASYVEGNVMIQEANIAFLFDWETGIDRIEMGDTAVSVIGWLQVCIDGRKIRRSTVGDQEINAKMNKQMAIKAAYTDMIKKGLSLFGFNGDVYRGDV